MNNLPLSVIIITFNEEHNIEECMKSVFEVAQEIIVVDSHSTDKTIEIARKYTGKIYSHEFENFAKQRNWAQENVPICNKWVFHLDSDERASTALVAELKKIFSSPIEYDGFMVSRKTIFRGRWIRHGGHFPSYHLRIFKKDKGKSEERMYDQNYIVDGKIKKIDGEIINIIDGDIMAWKTKHRKWSLLEAHEILFAQKTCRSINMKLFGTPIERTNWMRYNIYYRMPLFIRALLYFIYRYIVRLGFLDGKEGLIFHFLHGFWYRIIVDQRVMELKKTDVYFRY